MTITIKLKEKDATFFHEMAVGSTFLVGDIPHIKTDDGMVTCLASGAHFNVSAFLRCFPVHFTLMEV